MAKVFAVTRIDHGVEDTVTTYNVGDELSDLDEDTLRTLVEGGSAVEIGKGRKFSAPPAVPVGADAETRKRDELLQKALYDDDEGLVSPAAALAAGTIQPPEDAKSTPASATTGNQTVSTSKNK